MHKRQTDQKIESLRYKASSSSVLQTNKKKVFLESEMKKKMLYNSNAVITSRRQCVQKSARDVQLSFANKGEKARHLGTGMFSFLHFTHLFAGSVWAERFREELLCNHSWASGTTEDLRVGAVMGCVCVSMYVHVQICACVCIQLPLLWGSVSVL